MCMIYIVTFARRKKCGVNVELVVCYWAGVASVHHVVAVN